VDGIIVVGFDEVEGTEVVGSVGDVVVVVFTIGVDIEACWHPTDITVAIISNIAIIDFFSLPIYSTSIFIKPIKSTQFFNNPNHSLSV
jgi:hypothetical protein